MRHRETHAGVERATAARAPRPRPGSRARCRANHRRCAATRRRRALGVDEETRRGRSTPQRRVGLTARNSAARKHVSPEFLRAVRSRRAKYSSRRGKTVAAGVVARSRTRRAHLASRSSHRNHRLLHSWRPILSRLYTADDRRFRRRSPACNTLWLFAPSPIARTARRGAFTGRDANCPHRRRASDCRARLRHDNRFRAWTKFLGRAIATSPPQSNSSAAIAPSIFRPGRRKPSCSPQAAIAKWIAADLLAQAEHAPDAGSFLVTPSLKLASAVPARSRKRNWRISRRTIPRTLRCAIPAPSCSRRRSKAACDFV